MNIKTSKKSGFTLVEIMIVVAIIGLLAAIAIPNFVRARTQSQKNACINNLRQVDGAIQQWALETKQAPTAAWPAANVVLGYLKSESRCPSSGTTGTFTASYYNAANTVQSKPVCAIGGTGGSAVSAGYEHDLPLDTSN